MSKFLSHLIVEMSDDQRTAKLVCPLKYQSDLLGGTLTVHEGFETDWASIPRFFWRILPPTGLYGEPAVVHDYLYRSQPLPRATADAVLLEAMHAHGVDRLTCWVIYAGVRLGGWVAWASNKKKL